MSVVTTKQKIDAIVTAFGDVQQSSDGKNISTYCPVCAKSSKIKKKKKLSINLNTGVFHCWVCEAKGKNIHRFYVKNSARKNLGDKLKEAFPVLGKENEELKMEEVSICLPDDFKLLGVTKSRSANMIKKYLKKRGLDEDDLFRYRIGFSEKKEFKDGAIFASFDNNLELNYYLTRITRDDAFVKYKNCDVSKKNIIFNEDMIDWSKEVILVEGIFDAIKVGKNCIPILGSWIDENYALFRKIIQVGAKVTICLDYDARRKQIKIAKKMHEYGIEVKTVNLDNGLDLGDLSKKSASKLITTAKHFDNTQRMRYLISGIKSGSVF